MMRQVKIRFGRCGGGRSRMARPALAPPCGKKAAIAALVVFAAPVMVMPRLRAPAPADPAARCDVLAGGRARCIGVPLGEETARVGCRQGIARPVLPPPLAPFGADGIISGINAASPCAARRPGAGRDALAQARMTARGKTGLHPRYHSGTGMPA